MEVSKAATCVSSGVSSKPTVLTLFKQNYTKNSISGIVKIGDQQAYQGQPVTLTILNSPSITSSSKGTICLSNTSTYGNLLVKPEPLEAVSVAEQLCSQGQAHNVVNTVVVSSTTPSAHGSIQYLVPALPNIYVPQNDVQISASGERIW